MPRNYPPRPEPPGNQRSQDPHSAHPGAAGDPGRARANATRKARGRSDPSSGWRSRSPASRRRSSAPTGRGWTPPPIRPRPSPDRSVSRLDYHLGIDSPTVELDRRRIPGSSRERLPSPWSQPPPDTRGGDQARRMAGRRSGTRETRGSRSSATWTWRAGSSSRTSMWMG